MVLELHIWGPAFNNASINPECLAAVAYFSKAVPRDEWVLIAGNDIEISPTSS
jgi:sorting and assembly machinery component 37